MELLEIEGKLDQLIKAQVSNDKQTGTCGMEEAGFQEFHPAFAQRLSEEAQIEIIAICSIVNMLHDKLDEIMKQEMRAMMEKDPKMKHLFKILGGNDD